MNRVYLPPVLCPRVLLLSLRSRKLLYLEYVENIMLGIRMMYGRERYLLNSE